jgi:hypothetical protein
MDTMDIRFEIETEDSCITKSFVVDELESWTNIVLSCADFLSAQYGYGISEKILFITDYPSGRDREYCISTKEHEMILQYRKREKALDSLFDDEDTE